MSSAVADAPRGPGAIPGSSQAQAHDSTLHPSTRNLLFSYASQNVVKQAKLEAMEHRVKERLRKTAEEQKAAAKAQDPYNGLETAYSPQDAYDESGRPTLCLEPCRLEDGGVDQFDALVVPPEVGRTGDERSSTAKLVMQGQEKDFQKTRHLTAVGVQVPVSFGIRTLEDEEQEPAAAAAAAPASVRARSRSREAATAAAAAAAVAAAASPGDQLMTMQQQEQAKRADGAADRASGSNLSADAAGSSSQRRGGRSPSAPYKREKPSPPPPDPHLESLKQSRLVPYVPVQINAGVVPAKAVSSTAQVIGAVRDVVGNIIQGNYGPASAQERLLPQGSLGSGHAAIGPGDPTTTTSYTGGAELVAPSAAAAAAAAGARISSTGSSNITSSSGAPGGMMQQALAGAYGAKTAAPLLKVQEEDLMALYRQQSQQRLMQSISMHAAAEQQQQQQQLQQQQEAKQQQPVSRARSLSQGHQTSSWRSVSPGSSIHARQPQQAAGPTHHQQAAARAAASAAATAAAAAVSAAKVQELIGAMEPSNRELPAALKALLLDGDSSQEGAAAEGQRQQQSGNSGGMGAGSKGAADPSASAPPPLTMAQLRQQQQLLEQQRQKQRAERNPQQQQQPQEQQQQQQQPETTVASLLASIPDARSQAAGSGAAAGASAGATPRSQTGGQSQQQQQQQSGVPSQGADQRMLQYHHQQQHPSQAWTSNAYAPGSSFSAAARHTWVNPHHQQRLRRPASATAAAYGSGGKGWNRAGSFGAASSGSPQLEVGGTACVFKPPDVEARLAQQQRPSSAVHTRKTNSRDRAGSLTRSPQQQAAAVAAVPAAGSRGSSPRPELGNLQARVLEYMVGQMPREGTDAGAVHGYTASGGSPAAVRPPRPSTAPPSRPTGAPLSPYLQNSPAGFPRPRPASALVPKLPLHSAAPGGTGAGGNMRWPISARSTGSPGSGGGPVRPMSASNVPSRRTRPPSAGMWAGLPQKTLMECAEEEEEILYQAGGPWDLSTQQSDAMVVTISASGVAVPVGSSL